MIAIIAILAAILFPVFARISEKARQTSCLSNVKQLVLGTMMYTQDYDERFFDDAYIPGAPYACGPTCYNQCWWRFSNYVKELSDDELPQRNGPGRSPCTSGTGQLWVQHLAGHQKLGSIGAGHPDL